MVMLVPSVVLAFAAAASATLICALRFDPRRISGKAVTCFAQGATVIAAWNLLLPALPAGMNLISICLAGLLGMPGAAVSAMLPLL